MKVLRALVWLFAGFAIVGDVGWIFHGPHEMSWVRNAYAHFYGIIVTVLWLWWMLWYVLAPTTPPTGDET